MRIYLVVYANSNIPIMAYETKEECLKKIKKLEKTEERLIKKELLPKNKISAYAIKSVKLRRKRVKAHDK